MRASRSSADDVPILENSIAGVMPYTHKRPGDERAASRKGERVDVQRAKRLPPASFYLKPQLGRVRDAEVEQDAQTGAFRVNCKDCLDRTNVAQTALAFRALLKQALCCAFGGDVSPHVAIANETQQRLRKVHGALWSAHGDDVARLYARTRALRRDVTGSGRRSFLGALADARVAVARWWQSKFSDGEAQDAARYFTSGGELGGDPGRGGGLGFAPGERGEEAKERKERRARRGRGRFGASLSCLRLNQPEAVHADDAWALEVPRAKRREKTRRVAPAPARANERGDLER